MSVLNTLFKERDLINAKNTTYLTHNFHPFPAKFIPQIPRFLIERFTEQGETVLDPFCGCGTAIVEAKLCNRHSIGIDINPIGVLATKVKTSKISNTDLAQIPKFLAEVQRKISLLYKTKLKSFVREDLSLFLMASQEETISHLEYRVPTFPNRDHWFQQHVLHELAIIKEEIDKVQSKGLNEFLSLGFSAIIVPASNQESDTRYAAIDKDIPPRETFHLFKTKIKDMAIRIKEFNKKASDCRAKAYLKDTRYIDFLPDDSVDFIVTSPPYPNTYDYYLYHKLRMFWLGMDVKFAQNNEIGSRHKHSSKKEDISSYTRDMNLCFRHFNRILKPRKYFLIVVGDSVIRGKWYMGDELIGQIARENGFDFVEKIDYSLDKVSKTFIRAFRTKAKKEHMILFRNREN